MEYDKKEKTTYYLFQKDRIFRDKTLTTLYLNSNKSKKEKKSKPIDIDGFRYKLDIKSGEIYSYSKSEVLTSIHSSLKRTKILLNMLLEMNDFDWFATLTFDNEKIDRFNDCEVFNSYKKYIDNTKHQFPKFKYVCVPERHEDGCIHFHLLIGGLTVSQLGLVNSGKVCCSWATLKNNVCSREYFDKTKSKHQLRDTDGLNIYNITTFPYGYTTVTRIVSRERCNSYIKKYIEKALGSTDIFKKRFYYSSNLEVPKIVEKIVGPNFSSPRNIETLSFVKNNEHIKNSEYIIFNKDYNVMQFWEDNNIKNNINAGLLPVDKNIIFN